MSAVAAPTATLASQFTQSLDERLNMIRAAAAHLNELLRGAHGAGGVVIVTADDLCKTGEHPLPQVRVDVRTPENAVSRPEVLDV